MTGAAAPPLTNTPATPAGPGFSLPSWAVPASAAAIAVTDAAIFALIASRGSWYADDLDFLAVGKANSLDLGYLALPINDHLMPGLRLVYWAFAHLAPLDYSATVAFRVVLIVVADAAMYRLLVLLMGRRKLVLAPLAFYAFIPLTLPSDLSLSSAVNLLPTHVAGILLLDACVRFVATRRVMYAALASLWLLVGLCFWEKSVLILGTAVLLLLGFIMPGRWWRRVVDLCRLWQLWAPIAVALAMFGAAWLSTRDAGEITGRDLGGPSQALSIAKVAWLESVAPALLGGPWRWWTEEGHLLGLADPPALGVVAAQFAVLIGVVFGVRRCGRRALLAPLMVGAFIMGTSASLALGRATTFGTVPAVHFHYWSDLAITLTVAVVCAWIRLDREAIAARATDPPAARDRRANRSVILPSLDVVRPYCAVVALAMLSVLITDSAFARTWDDNPAGAYLDRVEQQLAERPGTVLYDMPLPTELLSPFLAQYHRLSGLTPMMDVNVEYNIAADAHLVTDDGTIVPAEIDPYVRHLPGDPDGCTYLVQGTRRIVVPLTGHTGPNMWFMRIGYLSNPSAAVRIAVADGLNPPIELTTTTSWPAGLNAEIITTPPNTDFDRVIIKGLQSDVNLCIGDVTVGLPVPRTP